MSFRERVIRIIKGILFLEQTDSLSVFYILKRWNIRFGRFFYHKKYSTADIVAVLRELGVNKGSNIFIHSAWDSFYNFKDDIESLLDSIINLIGPEGTLAMPAIPVTKPGKIFNVKRTPTSAGMLAELFRRYPGVSRSRNDFPSAPREACGQGCRLSSFPAFPRAFSFQGRCTYGRPCQGSPSR